MGSALTYVRRYALFALVGIAGEDDLDAPDLNVPARPESERPIGSNGQLKRQQHVTERAKGLRRRTQIAPEFKRPLQAELSAVLRVQLLEELTAIASTDEGVAWAQRRLEAKNTLMLPDADLVERAFREKMSCLEVLNGSCVCAQPCLICGRRPSDAHHLRFGQPRALGRRVSDEFLVPLCRVHHRDLHRRGDEKKWWEAARMDPIEVAQRLWREAHPHEP